MLSPLQFACNATVKVRAATQTKKFATPLAKNAFYLEKKELERRMQLKK